MRRLYLWASGIILIMLLTVSALYWLPHSFIPIEQKPNPVQQKPYEYYLIIDEKSGQHLMYVPLLVNVNDELITEDNKRYRVTRIEENRAYAQFVENIDLKKYKPATP